MGNDDLRGGADNDFLQGDGGDDVVDGGDGDDDARGGAGNDRILGGAGNDTLRGEGDNDILEGGEGNDTLFGDAGSDVASFAGSTAGVNVNLTISGAQVIGGGLGTDTLFDIEGLTGSAFDDVLIGNAFDGIFEGGAGNDTIDGAGGTDTLSYASAGAAVTVSLALTTAQNTGGAGTDTLTGLENLTGSAFNDTLTGSAANNVMRGGNGRDTVFGGLGEDTLYGEQGNDTLNGEAGEDRIEGGDNNDVLNGGADNDTLLGGTGDDVVAGDDGNDTIFGEDGLDTLRGGLGDDVIQGGLGDDSIDGGDGQDALYGGDGADVLRGGAGVDALNGGAADDWADYRDQTTAVSVTLNGANLAGVTIGGVAEDTLVNIENVYGGSGADRLTGDGLNNRLEGGDGDDFLLGGVGADILVGGAGNDTINGGSGALDTADYGAATAGVTVNLSLTTAQDTGGAGIDTVLGIENLIGSAFGDMLLGSASANTLTDTQGGNDSLIGYAGNDVLTVSRSGAGAATTVSLSGRTENDTLTFSGNGRFTDSVTLNGDEGADVITVSGVGTAVINAGSENDTVVIDTLGGSYNITLGGGSDTLRLASTGGVFVGSTSNIVRDFTLGAGGDVLDLAAYIAGGALTGLAAGANPFLTGHMRLFQSGTATLLQVDRNGGADAFTTLLTFRARSITSFTAENFSGLSPFPPAVEGTSGADTLNGTAGVDVLNGQGGNDTLNGRRGDDVLNGGSGNDVLIGGEGDDTMNGGAGTADVANYESATAGVTVSLITTTSQDTVGAGFDTLIAIENLIGSAYADTFTGNDLANTLIDTLGGNDLLNGALGDDIVTVIRSGGGAATNVTLNGRDGADTLTFNGNGRFTDTVTFNADEGIDTIVVSGAAVATVNAGTEADTVTIDALGGAYTVTLGTGSDTLRLASTGGAAAVGTAHFIRDFATGAGGDVMDLSAYLAGGALSGFAAGGNPFATGHMRLLQSGSQTLLQVDQNGGGNSYVTLLTFRATTASTFTAANLGGINPFPSAPALVIVDDKFSSWAPQVLTGLTGDDITRDAFDMAVHLAGSGFGSGHEAIVDGDLWAKADSSLQIGGPDHVVFDYQQAYWI